MCDRPNESLDKWKGLLRFNTDRDNVINCGIKNLLLRGSTLRNTEWAVGLVVYAGHDTKILMNSKRPPYKISNVMHLMNKMLLSVFVFQLFIIFFCAGLNYKWTKENSSKHPESGTD